MYKVSIYNEGVETVIHYPTANKDAPHLLNLPFKESLSQPEQLSFSVPYNNPGFNLIQGLTTKIKVFDTRDNSIVFTGRVIPIKDHMTQEGNFLKEVMCEGALAYLNDTNTRRWNFANKTPAEILTYLLNEHNSKVDATRQIQLGIVELTQAITIDTNYETTLNAIVTKLRNILGGDIKVRESNEVLCLDYLQQQGNNNNVEVRIGYNLKEIIKDYDPTDIVTRVIPLGYGEGINQLDIASINGVEYIEDAGAVSQYGVIEGVVTNKDIQNATTLKIYGDTVLNNKKQPRFTYSIGALDLSVLTGHDNEKYELGDTLHTVIRPLSIDVYSRVIERTRDLLVNPWDPQLTISTRPVRLSNEIVNLKQRNMSLELAPQGSTYIDTFGYAENIDADHSFNLPVWLSPDILNVNRVRLYIEGQKYRAYERSVASSSQATSTVSLVGGEIATSIQQDITDEFGQPTGNHLHFYNRNHSHTVIIPSHTHGLDYGIFEEDYPQDVYVKVNGTEVAGPFASDGNAFSIELDLSQYVSVPGQTYNVEVTSSRNGRVNVWVSVQAFIQAK